MRRASASPRPVAPAARAPARSIEVVATAMRVRVSVRRALGGAQPRRREGRRAALVLSADDERSVRAMRRAGEFLALRVANDVLCDGCDPFPDPLSWRGLVSHPHKGFCDADVATRTAEVGGESWGCRPAARACGACSSGWGS